jgi:hypothetical protein
LEECDNDVDGFNGVVAEAAHVRGSDEVAASIVAADPATALGDLEMGTAQQGKVDQTAL